MVTILDNSNNSADIVIVMPKPDALSRDEFSYSNLYSFDYYDGITGSSAGVTSSITAGCEPTEESSSEKLVSFIINLRS